MIRRVCGWIQKNPRVHLTKHSLRQFQRTRCIFSAATFALPGHTRPSQKSVGWFRREPAASSAPLPHGTDLSDRSPGNTPKQQEGFPMEGVDLTQLLPHQNVVHVHSSEVTQARQKLWWLANVDLISAVTTSNQLIKPDTVIFLNPTCYSSLMERRKSQKVTANSLSL